MVTFHPLIAPLFVPATRPDRFRKAADSGADAIIVDLEDAVPAGEKERARDALANGPLNGLAVPIFLRINSGTTPWHDRDLAAAGRLPIAGIMLPKTERTSDLALVARSLGPDVPVIALVETALGVANVHQIAKAPNLAQIAFGSVDFALDIAAAHERDSLAFARGQIVLYSRVCGLPAPLDGVTVTTGDPSALAADSAHAAAMGFGGKLAIHPAQIGPIQNAFRPSPQDVDWANRVLAAERAAGGVATQLDGVMIDTPISERARRLLAKAK
ncbi:CoA ester lyase [Sinorhizobium sp. RAC02]|uniref:HpcH/HpaI aldolase/citrate lyase family protein n=1 Tax=Sinorhizobium sp. RAC02 TaxID=1842534 RepID=UPI00083D532F|nr:CoA ester lyase [Sinorhizobium sp. RAC02]AOF92300.1 hpcH/HpaI aldolase/citrate lyase family protein [Sinorhizobium sp. RAC02]